jgi:hypothetical protein
MAAPVKVQYSGVTLDLPTLAALAVAQADLGYVLPLMQGSFNPGVSASAGTHDGGGAVDVGLNAGADSFAVQVAKVKALRRAGFRAWRRTPAQGFPYHVHCILAGDPWLSPAAAAQLVQWDNRQNGLADHGPDDDPVDVAAGRPGGTVAKPIVLDIAWATPTVLQILATGAVGVIRYFSTDKTKDLTTVEVIAYRAAALGIGTVYETTAGRATAGYAAGQADARAAEAERIGVGLPSGHIHYFAVDEDVPWSSADPYFAGASSVLGKANTGVYGGVRVIDGAAAAGYHWLWQTAAWSGGAVSAHALLYQNGGTTLGGGADVNTVLATDWGQYPRPTNPTPPPVVVEELEMYIVAVDRAPYTSNPSSWPGEFLLGSDGSLHHIVDTPDLTAFQKLGIKGPVIISKAQYDSLLAGK